MPANTAPYTSITYKMSTDPPDEPDQLQLIWRTGHIRLDGRAYFLPMFDLAIFGRFPILYEGARVCSWIKMSARKECIRLRVCRKDGKGRECTSEWQRGKYVHKTPPINSYQRTWSLALISAPLSSSIVRTLGLAPQFVEAKCSGVDPFWYHKVVLF
jgi:hypothetical protein